MQWFCNKVVFSFIASILLSGCFFFDNDFDPIVAEYNIGWIDTEETRSICKGLEVGDTGGETVVQEYVFAVGHNNQYIVAKQHPLDYTKSPIVDTKTINYFVIDYTKHPYAGQQGIFGPIDLNAYKKLNSELGIGEVEFDMIYPDDPN